MCEDHAETTALLSKAIKPIDLHALREYMDAEKARAAAAFKEARAAAVEGALAVMEDGATLKLAEKNELVEELVRVFGAPRLCLKVCNVPTDVHPGARLSRGPEDLGVPVCPLPADLPHVYHMCLPSDTNRYRVCPLPKCGDVVPTRAIKRHVQAHLGINRVAPEILARNRREKVAAAVEAWLAAAPEDWSGKDSLTRSWSGDRVLSMGYLVIRFVEALRDGKDGAFWKSALKAAAKAKDLPLPPLGVKEIAKKGEP